MMGDGGGPELREAARAGEPGGAGHRTCAGGAARQGGAVECGRDRGHGNCPALAPVGRGGVANSPPVPRHRGRGAGNAPESGRKNHAVPAATVERLLELALSEPPAGHSPWTTRLLAQEVCPRKCVPGSVSQEVCPTCCAATRSSCRGCAHTCAHTKGEPRRRVRGEVRDSVRLYLNPPEPSFRQVKQRRTSAMGVSLEK